MKRILFLVAQTVFILAIVTCMAESTPEPVFSPTRPLGPIPTSVLTPTATLPPTPAEPTATPIAEAIRTATDGDFVAVHYTGTLDNGDIFDSSTGRDPLTFTLGSGQMIPGFDEAIHGLFIGETVVVRLKPGQAYGERREDLILDLPLTPETEGIVPGDRVRLSNGTIAVALQVTEETIRVDANHQLAGEALTFLIELISIE